MKTKCWSTSYLTPMLQCTEKRHTGLGKGFVERRQWRLNLQVRKLRKQEKTQPQTNSAENLHFKPWRFSLEEQGATKMQRKSKSITWIEQWPWEMSPNHFKGWFRMWYRWVCGGSLEDVNRLVGYTSCCVIHTQTGVVHSTSTEQLVRIN